MVYFVYILQSLKDHSYYVGSTQDLAERINRHNQGRSKYTKAKKRPWKLVYHEEFDTKSEAMDRENELKSYQGRKFIREGILPMR